MNVQKIKHSPFNDNKNTELNLNTGQSTSKNKLTNEMSETTNLTPLNLINNYTKPNQKYGGNTLKYCKFNFHNFLSSKPSKFTRRKIYYSYKSNRYVKR